MFWYWLIELYRTFVVLFTLPKPEDLAIRDRNARCPCCGRRKGELRCVVQIKAGPQNPEKAAETAILCQHRCHECGARWYEKPILEDVTTDKLLPSVARNPIEEKEDRMAKLYGAPA